MPKAQRFKKGETVKAFVKLGVQREELWTTMEYLKRRGGAYVVRHYTGQERAVFPQHIRAWHRIEDHQAATVALEQDFPNLVAQVRRAVAELLPEKWQGIVVSDAEKSITLASAGLTVQAGVVDMVKRTLMGETVQEVAAWTVTHYEAIPATRDSPPDGDVIDDGHALTASTAAALLVQKAWECHHTNFWEMVGEEQYAASLESEASFLP